MAQKVVVSLVDDLSGGRADHTVRFSLDGKDYEIDLSEQNAAVLSEVMAEYVAAARRPNQSRRTDRGPAMISTADRQRNQVMREWARQHGMSVSERGRIPTDVIRAYHQENHQES